MNARPIFTLILLIAFDSARAQAPEAPLLEV